MKKSALLTILGFALIHFNFSNKLFVSLGIGLFMNNELNSQNIIPYLDVTNHTYNWIISNSPGNTPQTAIVLTRMAYDSIFFRQKYIKFDTLNIIPSTAINGKLIWMKSNGIVAVTSFSDVSVPYSQITGTPTIPPSQVNSDWNSSSGVSQILNKPSLYSPSGTTSQYLRGDGSAVIFPTVPQTLTLTGIGDAIVIGTAPTLTVSVSSPTNLNQLTNGPGYISSYSPTLTTSGYSIGIVNGNTLALPPSIISISGQTISLSNSGGSVVIPTQTTTLTSPQVTTALGYIPLAFEVDGNVTNEIQTLSGSGTQTISLSSGGTFVIPTQTTVLTSGQVTTALGYVPATNTVVSDKTVTIISTNNLLTISSSYPSFTIAPYTQTTYTASRSISGGTFQVSANYPSFVAYSVRITCNLTLILTSAGGTVSLQYSTNNGSTWIDVGQVENGSNFALAGSNTQGGMLCGWIPAAAIVRMNTTVLSGGGIGTTTAVFVRGQETF